MFKDVLDEVYDVYVVDGKFVANSSLSEEHSISLKYVRRAVDFIFQYNVKEVIINPV